MRSDVSTKDTRSVLRSAQGARSRYVSDCYVIAVRFLAYAIAMPIGMAQSGQWSAQSGWSGLDVWDSLARVAMSTDARRWRSIRELLTQRSKCYAIALCIVIVIFFENGEVIWSSTFILAMTWQVLALSIGAILLLMTMIKHGASASVGSYFYLVAPLVAIQAWILFGETIGLSALAGVILISCGVAITTSRKSLRNI